jgi:hypothetical protein
MALMSAQVEVLVLFPFAPYHWGLDAQTLWGWSSGVGVVIVLFFNRAVTRASVGTDFRIIWSDPNVSKIAVVLGYSSFWVSLLLLGLNAAGFLLDQSFGPYLLVVLLFFGNALYAFVRLLNRAVGTAKPTALGSS